MAIRAFSLAFVLAFVLCVGSSPASASRSIRTSSGAATSFTATGVVTYTAGAISLTCVWGLTMQFSGEVPKVAGGLLLTVTNGTISACNGAISGIVLPTLQVGYRSFVGTLPSISAVSGRSSTPLGFLFSGGFWGGGCLFSAAAGALAMTLSGNPVTVLQFAGGVTLARALPGSSCPATMTLSSGPMTVDRPVGLALGD